MSTQMMAKIWPLQMPTVAKAVYISLADNANDHGLCWPSIPTISKRVCASERAVYNAIKWLEKNNALTKNHNAGKSTHYTLTPELYSPLTDSHPCTTFTPPLHDVHPTPAPSAVHPCTTFTQTVIEPSLNRKRTVNIKEPNLLEGVDEDVAADFQKLRKAKKAPLTKTAIKAIQTEAEKAGMTLEQALTVCCQRGWVGFKAAWVENDSPNSKPQVLSFRERDELAKRKSWEEMTGRKWPEEDSREVIDMNFTAGLLEHDNDTESN